MPATSRKGLVLMVTWSDLFSFIAMLCAVITLVTNNKRKIAPHPQSVALFCNTYFAGCLLYLYNPCHFRFNSLQCIINGFWAFIQKLCNRLIIDSQQMQMQYPIFQITQPFFNSCSIICRYSLFRNNSSGLLSFIV